MSGPSAKAAVAPPAFSLVSRSLKPDPTIVACAAGARIGGPEVVMIAGPCAVENYDMLLACAMAARSAGASMLRGGAFKPRTSPYAFPGLGLEALKMLQAARAETGLPVVTEVTEPGQVELVASYADMLQVGARNMQNFDLLRQLGRSGKPVMLKRGMMASVEEWLQAAEYILAYGNMQVVLCERGIRTFETCTRNTLDLGAVAAVKGLSHLPVIADPSHAAGRRELVIPLAAAAIAAGADGVMVEVHPDPDNALSDGRQSLYLGQLDELRATLEAIAPAVGRGVARCA